MQRSHELPPVLNTNITDMEPLPLNKNNPFSMVLGDMRSNRKQVRPANHTSLTQVDPNGKFNVPSVLDNVNVAALIATTMNPYNAVTQSVSSISRYGRSIV